MAAIEIFGAILGSEIVKTCWQGVVGNYSHSGLEWLRGLLSNRTPANRELLKAMHGCFRSSIRIMAAACDGIDGDSGDSRIARRKLADYSRSTELATLDLDNPDLPNDVLEAQIGDIYGSQSGDGYITATEQVIAFLERKIGCVLPPALRSVFYEGDGEVKGWALNFELLFAEQINSNVRIRDILLVSRAKELVTIANTSLLHIKALSDRLAQVENAVDSGFDRQHDRHDETQELIRRDKHEQALADIVSGTASPELMSRYQQALMARRQDGSQVRDREAAEFAIAAEDVRGSDDPRIREIAEMIDQGRLIEAADRKAQIAEEAVRTAASDLRAAAYIALPVSPGKAMDHLKRATELDPSDVWSWINLGRLKMQYGLLGDARHCVEMALQCPTDEHALVALHFDSGEISLVEGRVQEARADFEAGLSRAQRRAVSARTDGRAIRDVAIAFHKLGGVAITLGLLGKARDLYGARLAICERLAADNPGNIELQRDHSITLNKLGEVEMATGNLGAARAHIEAGLALSVKTAAHDPSNTQWQRDFSCDLMSIGDVEAATGNLSAARTQFEKGLAIRQNLAEREPLNTEWQRDVSVSFNRLGDIERLAGNLPRARERFEAALSIAERLATNEPRNAGWQSDLAFTLKKLGEIELNSGNLARARERFQPSLAIAERLSAQDPHNANWQREYSVNLLCLGDVERLQGLFAQARRKLETALAIRMRLALREPGNADRQRDLFISHANLAQLAKSEGDRTRAATDFEAAQVVIEKIARNWPNHPLFARDLGRVREELRCLRP